MGVRSSDIVNLKIDNFDWKNKKLTFVQVKTGKAVSLPIPTDAGNSVYKYIVYLPQDGAETLAVYSRCIEKQFPASIWLFPGQNPDEPISASAIRHRFINCWNQLPFAAKTGKHPTPHCLRHAFVVERMNDWMQNGVNIQEMLPYLSSYLGHKSPAETFYYYHLVNKAFAVVRQNDTVSNRVIPEVLDYEEL